MADQHMAIFDMKYGKKKEEPMAQMLRMGWRNTRNEPGIDYYHSAFCITSFFSFSVCFLSLRMCCF